MTMVQVEYKRKVLHFHLSALKEKPKQTHYSRSRAEKQYQFGDDASATAVVYQQQIGVLAVSFYYFNTKLCHVAGIQTKSYPEAIKQGIAQLENDLNHVT